MTLDNDNRAAVERLIGIADFRSVVPSEQPREFETDDVGHQWLLTRVGNLTAFDGCLRCFGLSNERLPSLRQWNNSTWRKEYGDLCSGLVFFGEDLLGNQFAFYNGGVVRFDVETGAKEQIASDFAGFADRAVTEPDELSNAWLLRLWRNAGKEALGANQHLVPLVPFVTGGTFTPENLYAEERYESMTFRGQIAAQIKDLPPGKNIRLRARR